MLRLIKKFLFDGYLIEEKIEETDRGKIYCFEDMLDLLRENSALHRDKSPVNSKDMFPGYSKKSVDRFLSRFPTWKAVSKQIKN